MNDTVKELVNRLRDEDRYRKGPSDRVRSAAADALEALERSTADLELVAKAAGLVVVEFMRERDALRVELDALRGQKPFAWYDPSADKFTRDLDDPAMNRGATLWRLYLDVGAKP